MTHRLLQDLHKPLSNSISPHFTTKLLSVTSAFFFIAPFKLPLKDKQDLTRISLPIATNGKPLAVIGKFPSATGKLMISKTLATNGEEITNAIVGNDVLANYW